MLNLFCVRTLILINTYYVLEMLNIIVVNIIGFTALKISCGRCTVIIQKIASYKFYYSVPYTHYTS